MDVIWQLTGRISFLPNLFSLVETVKWFQVTPLGKASSVDLPHGGHYKAASLLGNQLS